MKKIKYTERVLEKAIMKAVKTFPAVVVTGPRQSGKTTLFRRLFSGTHAYLSLEDTDMRIRAQDDPRAFLKQFKPPVIIDEIQYVPELLTYIKTRIDDERKPGQWLLTGSQHFSLMHNVTQSLAGRTAVLYLLPFSISERTGNTRRSRNVSSWLQDLDSRRINLRKNRYRNLMLHEFLLRGFYPEIAVNRRVDRKLWCSSYITTYLERDIRNLSSIGDLGQFERFLIACAVRTGQILNLSDMARDIGISVPTARRWLSLLETGQQVYLLYPYYRNVGKRIVKSPKLYFIDPAICTYLLGLDDARILYKNPSFGSLFETMIVGDFLKRYLHAGARSSMYYLRSRDGLEVDLVIERAGKLYLFEVKSAMTIMPRHAASLVKLRNDPNVRKSVAGAAIISAAESDFMVTKGIPNYSWQSVLTE